MTFVNIDVSSNEYMKQTKENLQSVYFDGFTGIDGKYRIVITYPITSVDDGRYIGTVVAYLPTIEFFKNYGNGYENSNKSIYVIGDKMKLSRVLHNLLDNAGKFTKKGSITITTAIKSHKVQVTVKDTGIGIHPEIFPKLFSKFVTKSDRVTGLSLFISKSIIEAHGSNI